MSARAEAATGPKGLGRGQTPSAQLVGNALAVDISGTFEPEGFAVFAEGEIAAAPYHVFGECFFPDCSRSFNPTRRWQMYCCPKCRDADTLEMRRWGHKSAPALLVWRTFKYSKQPAQANLVRAARRYVTSVQSTWLSSRKFRAARARQMRAQA